MSMSMCGPRVVRVVQSLVVRVPCTCSTEMLQSCVLLCLRFRVSVSCLVRISVCSVEIVLGKTTVIGMWQGIRAVGARAGRGCRRARLPRARAFR